MITEKNILVLKILICSSVNFHVGAKLQSQHTFLLANLFLGHNRTDVIDERQNKADLRCTLIVECHAT